MKKILSFFLLLCQINSSMLLPQIGQVNFFAVNERQLDDINSLIEYVDEVLLGNRDTTPDDDNKEEAREIDTIKYGDYIYHPALAFIKIYTVSMPDIIYKNFSHPALAAISIDITTPPPEA